MHRARATLLWARVLLVDFFSGEDEGEDMEDMGRATRSGRRSESLARMSKARSASLLVMLPTKNAGRYTCG